MKTLVNKTHATVLLFSIEYKVQLTLTMYHFSQSFHMLELLEALRLWTV